MVVHIEVDTAPVVMVDTHEDIADTDEGTVDIVEDMADPYQKVEHWSIRTITRCLSLSPVDVQVAYESFLDLSIDEDQEAVFLVAVSLG